MKAHENLLIIIEKAVEEFKGVTDESWTKKSRPGKWSKKQILGHLVDSALTNLRRFVVTQYKQNQKIVYHQDEWVEIQNHQGRDLRELIELWRLLNSQIASVIREMPKLKLQNMCDTGKDSIENHSLEFLIADYIKHLEHHLNQILEV